ncbi:MAG: DUF4399 domain-containing protein [Bacteroidota bacterium]
MKKLFATIIAVAFLTACGGEANTAKDEAKTDNTEATAPEKDETPVGPPLVTVPDSAMVFFANLTDGATVSSPVAVEFGVKGMEVEPAGEVKDGYGHHHVIIDGGVIPTGETVPANDTHIHYGGGQTADTLTLAPGSHTLTMQFADGLHRSYGEQMAATISITVE